MLIGGPVAGLIRHILPTIIIYLCQKSGGGGRMHVWIVCNSLIGCFLKTSVVLESISTSGTVDRFLYFPTYFIEALFC